MVNFLKHNEIDITKWDDTVRRSKAASVFFSTETLDILTSPDTWNALILNDYDAVMPLPSRKKGPLNYIYPPFFLPHLGIFSKIPLTSQIVDDFLKAIPKQFVIADIILNEFNPTPANEETFVMTSHQLDLQYSYDNLYSNFSNNTKRNVKYAEKQNFALLINENLINETINLFKNNRGLQKDVNFSKNDYHRLAAATHHLLAKGVCDVYSVIDGDSGKLAAGAFFVKDNSTAWFWFSGRDNSLSDGFPMFYLINQFIKNNAGLNLTLDFNGSSNPNIARMYHGFGGIPYHFNGVKLYKNQFWNFASKCYFKLSSTLRTK